MGSFPETYNDLGIPCGGIPPGSPISDQNMSFANPFSDVAPKKLCHHDLDKNSNKKNIS